MGDRLTVALYLRHQNYPGLPGGPPLLGGFLYAGNLLPDEALTLAEPMRQEVPPTLVDNHDPIDTMGTSFVQSRDEENPRRSPRSTVRDSFRDLPE